MLHPELRQAFYKDLAKKIGSTSIAHPRDLLKVLLRFEEEWDSGRLTKSWFRAYYKPILDSIVDSLEQITPNLSRVEVQFVANVLSKVCIDEWDGKLSKLESAWS